MIVLRDSYQSRNFTLDYGVLLLVVGAVVGIIRALLNCFGLSVFVLTDAGVVLLSISVNSRGVVLFFIVTFCFGGVLSIVTMFDQLLKLQL